jgi:hypothetical protein
MEAKCPPKEAYSAHYTIKTGETSLPETELCQLTTQHAHHSEYEMDKEDETEKEQDGKHGAYIVHTHDGKTAPLNSGM